MLGLGLGLELGFGRDVDEDGDVDRERRVIMVGVEPAREASMSCKVGEGRG